jgi:hypothetical protein
LTASVPEAVKTISAGSTPNAPAARSRAASSAARARRPSAWGLAGLPGGSLATASATSGSTPVPAAWSR